MWNSSDCCNIYIYNQCTQNRSFAMMQTYISPIFFVSSVCVWLYVYVYGCVCVCHNNDCIFPQHVFATIILSAREYLRCAFAGIELKFISCIFHDLISMRAEFHLSLTSATLWHGVCFASPLLKYNFRGRIFARKSFSAKIEINGLLVSRCAV